MAQSDTQITNALETSVSELASALKRTLEDQFNYVRVRGEISGYKGPHTSGHAYFSLKDQFARLDAVIWRTSWHRLKFKPEDGLEAVVSGRITTYAGKSSYQIVVDTLEPAGAGALMALLDARRRQLTAEGLFDQDRKKPLPFLPRVIGVITSPTGVVIRDIIHRLADRYPTHVIVWPVRVQGDGSAEDVASAVKGFNTFSATGPLPRPDVVIVARGGGSMEDLWGFNHEVVVRAVAESRIPLISAVGHETDWTLIDYAADLRAPTPTAAAELCAPVRLELRARVERAGTRAVDGISRRTRENSAALQSAARALPSAKTPILVAARRLDLKANILTASLREQLQERRHKSVLLSGVLQRRSPNNLLAQWSQRIVSLQSKLANFRVTHSVISRQTFHHAHETLLRVVHTAACRRRERHASFLLRWEAKVIDCQRTPTRLRGVLSSKSSLQQKIYNIIERQRAGSRGLVQVFAALSYRSVLARGYALVLDANSTPLTNVAAASAAKEITILFADGKLDATSGSRTRRPKRGRKGSPNEQQNLLF